MVLGNRKRKLIFGGKCASATGDGCLDTRAVVSVDPAPVKDSSVEYRECNGTFHVCPDLPVESLVSSVKPLSYVVNVFYHLCE